MFKDIYCLQNGYLLYRIYWKMIAFLHSMPFFWFSLYCISSVLRGGITWKIPPVA